MRIAVVVIGSLALVGVAVCSLVLLFIGFQIEDLVNDKLPATSRFDPLGWYPAKRKRLIREYKRLYPQGRLVARTCVFQLLGLVCLLLCFWSFGSWVK